MGDAPVRVGPEGDPVIRWLMTEGCQITDAKAFLANFASCLRDAGVDVSRITTGVPVLHPQLFSMSSLWERDRGVTERLYRIDPSQDAILANSPIRSAYDGSPFRSRLTTPAEEREFPFSRSCVAAASPITSSCPFPSATEPTKLSRSLRPGPEDSPMTRLRCSRR